MVMTFFCVHASCGVFLHIQICAAKKKQKNNLKAASKVPANL